MRELLVLLTVVVGMVAEVAAAEPPPELDIVFCVDTTAGMDVELRALKKKVRPVAKALRRGRPQPLVRFGVVAYRDKDEAYRTKRLPLTDDTEAVRSFVDGLDAAGGGGLEDVRAGLHEAVTATTWGKGARVVVLLGDAGPDDWKDDNPSCSRTAMAAKEAGVVIVTLACGGMALEGVAQWKRVAELTGGAYEELPNSGRRQPAATPSDCGGACASCTLPCAMAGGDHAPPPDEPATPTGPSTATAFENAVLKHVGAIARRRGIMYE